MKIIYSLLFVVLSGGVMAQKFEGLAQTPPMGWNSWNKFGCNVNEKMIRDMADAMVSSGMKDAGYQYIVIDDCWQVDRDENGRIIPDPERFKSGMKSLAEYIHSKGLKFGLYSDAGTQTCQGRPGSRGHEFADARTYASWGVDYLKYDWCNSGKQNAEASYSTMRDALYAAGRPIVFSLCEWGSNDPWLWAPDVGNLWRTTGDIQDCYDCTINWGGKGWVQILDENAGLGRYAGPGHWNDPDMLEVGNGGMTKIEDRAHFTLWCMMAAPLIAGNDLRSMSDETAEILMNKEMIAIDQDPLGVQGYRAMTANDMEIWVKPLKNGEFAVCFFNRGNFPKNLDYQWSRHSFSSYGNKTLDFSTPWKLHDLWQHKDVGTTGNNLKITLQPHDVAVYRLSK